MNRIKCATFNKEMQDSIPPEIIKKMKADRAKAEKGRDPVFKCAVCGKWIAYDDIPDKVKADFTPDSEYTTEAKSFTHLHCL